jgi:hypothetical protein
MRIDNSSVTLKSESWRKTEEVRTETIKTSTNEENTSKSFLDEIDWSAQAKVFMEQSLKSTSRVEEENSFDLSDEDDQKIRLIKEMLSWLTGETVELRLPQLDYSKNKAMGLHESKGTPAKNVQRFDYKYSEEITDTESYSFKAVGQVKTKDGKDIKFDMNINFNRTLIQNKKIEMKAQQAMVDPLVINFESDIPSLHDKSINFDIDSNGTLDNLPFFSNAGYLAIDKNKDGVINDGSELFGPASGNGFGELGEYDDDGNGWIDENDSVFKDLVVWTMDEGGKQQLLAALKADVGAIYLGNTNTNFRLLDSQGQMAASISQSGIYLKESGGVSAITHIDVKL